MRKRGPYSRVLILGMDGLDPARVARMVGAGELPAFARLQREGRLGELATSNPAESPVAWSSLATGCNPGKHGIFDFIHRDPRGYVPRLSLQRSETGKLTSGGGYVCARHRPGFWRHTSDLGVPTTVVRWPVTFPAEPVNGRFLAGLGVPDVCGRLGRHTLYTTAAHKEDEESVLPVAWKRNRIVTHLMGPEVTGLARARPSRAKLVIERTDNGVALSVGTQCHHVELGQWSDWFNVRFQWGPVRICDALVKFHLAGVNPDLCLSSTPPQIDPKNQLWPLTQPADYGSELADLLGPFYTLGMPEDTHAVTEGRYGLGAFLQQCDEIDRQRRAMLECELNRFDEGVLAFVFDAGDRVQHMFWCIDDPTSPTFDPIRAREYGHVIPDLYRQMDGVLETALTSVDDDTAVFVVSDHGFTSFHRAVHVNRWLVENGFMVLKDKGEGRSLLQDVDWSRTQAYAVGFTGIYLNRAGRESSGTVKAGDDAQGVLRGLTAGLCGARDPDSGASMVRNTYLGDEIYWGPHVADGPDLLIGFEPGYRASWQTALGGVPGGVVIDNDKLWAADHLVDPTAVPGVLGTNLPIACELPVGIDLAPTVFDCLGLPVPDGLDGSSWLGEAPARKPTPDIQEEPALEPVGALQHDTAPDGLDDEQRAELERHLADLGYL